MRTSFNIGDVQQLIRETDNPAELQLRLTEMIEAAFPIPTSPKNEASTSSQDRE
jgi:hypothetical protein